jgi:hypothetical protein|tara:strand:- start:287 stop:1297 length:1011 start_codon:yes stop_codon:yes gene_type:complete
MAYSGNVGVKTFNALKVVDHAFRRCRLPAQAITSEMQDYALDSLTFMLDELANIRTPAWCIEQQILPLYENNQIVTLPKGTIDVLNLNLNILQELSGAVTATNTSYLVNFTTPTIVNFIGIKWSAAAIPVTFQTSSDNVTWVTVGTSTSQDLSTNATAVAGNITWTQINGALARQYFRIISTDGASTISYTTITLGNMPQAIPLGVLNRDNYVNQSNLVFAGRPSSFYYQRDIPQPVVNLWPAPNAASEKYQLVLWRHRQIMDTDNLQQQIEIPNRWLEAIINGLAARVCAETVSADASLIPTLEAKAAMSVQRAWDGDNDGSPIQINPGIGVYTA